jgi:hypothetical protein
MGRVSQSETSTKEWDETSSSLRLDDRKKAFDAYFFGSFLALASPGR